MMFDYENESKLMLCTFTQIEDYQAVNPYDFGLTEEYLLSQDFVGRDVSHDLEII
jgi:hypothetical protein